MTPFIERTIRDTPTTTWDKTRTNILVKLMSRVAPYRVHSDGSQYWIKWDGNYHYFTPAELGIATTPELAVVKEALAA